MCLISGIALRSSPIIVLYKQIFPVPQPASGGLNNRQDNLPLIEEATEREPGGSRIINFKHIIN
jgi:hypothetical protein